MDYVRACAESYAKEIHGEEYNLPEFAPDVSNTIRDFKAGFRMAMEILSSS